MLTFLLYALAPVAVAFGGDKLLLRTRHYVLRSVIDSATHGLVGLLSWLILIYRSPTNKGYILSSNFEILLSGILASAIDLDHFFAARSFRLRDALNIGPRRPSLHSSSLLLVVVFPMLAIGKAFIRRGILFRLGLLILVAVGSHHIRDGVRRGLWFPPWGSTSPLPLSVYLTSIGLLPHICAAFIPLRSVVAIPINVV